MLLDDLAGFAKLVATPVGSDLAALGFSCHCDWANVVGDRQCVVSAIAASPNHAAVWLVACTTVVSADLSDWFFVVYCIDEDKNLAK